MPLLRGIHIVRSPYAPWEPLFVALASHPSFSILTLEREGRWELPPFRSERKSVLRPCAPSLVSLHIPARLIDMQIWPTLAWNKLEELYIMDLERFHIPLIHLLVHMPKLRTFRCKSRWKLPPSTLVAPVRPDGAEGPVLQRLEEMVIESLSPNDKILSFLPPSLRSLSILCSPRFTVVEAHVTPPTSSQLQEMLQDSGMSANLRSLRFSIQGAIDDRLLEYIAARFPALEVLHVQRNAIGGVFSETASSIALALRNFRCLRELSLDIGHVDDPKYRMRQKEDHILDAQRWALTLANALSSLNLVAVPHISARHRSFWLPFRIRRDPVDAHERAVLAEDCELASGYFSIDLRPQPTQFARRTQTSA
ncbi:hypothetical protein C8J57DRAFT_427003 [Mycena rebaudengoi]|nr:hypothetical protein C8J57DRAFT_427003 [Mycena rebaudengoi]